MPCEAATGSGRDPRVARRDRGATSAEYALIAGLIAVVIVGAVALFGGAVAASFTDSGSQIESAVTGP